MSGSRNKSVCARDRSGSALVSARAAHKRRRPVGLAATSSPIRDLADKGLPGVPAREGGFSDGELLTIFSKAEYR